MNKRNMYWSNFLHFYQPPTQKEYWVRRVADESYRKILQGMKNCPNGKLTLNINGILLELLERFGRADVIDDLKELIKIGQIELTGSAKYHAMLPFLPKSEIIRQIRLNEQTLRSYLGSGLELKGFFPPEMAFDPKLLPILKSLGYQWIIVDELSFPQGRTIEYDCIYESADASRMQLFFRERKMSWVILSGQIGTGNLLVKSLGQRLDRNEYLLTAMDGETFGHHRPGLENLLFEIYRSDLKTAKISELPGLFSARERVAALPSTWALMQKDLEQHKPFSRWHDKNNRIHKLQWELTNLAIKTVKGSERLRGYAQARKMLDAALHSDQYWWASARPWWSIEMIERGAKDFTGALAALRSTSPAVRRVQDKAQELYAKIIFTAFDWQRSGIVDQLSHQEDEDIRQRTDSGIPRLPKAEIDKMIAKLEQEMRSVANNQEFERAAQIRDRIAELRRYISDDGEMKTSHPGTQEFNLAE